MDQKPPAATRLNVEIHQSHGTALLDEYPDLLYLKLDLARWLWGDSQVDSWHANKDF